MNRCFLAAALIFAAVFTAAAADTPPKPADAPTAPAATVPLKGKLPAHYKSLGLTEIQRQKVLTITADSKTKLDKLTAEITALKDDEHKQLNALLTDEQRTHLAELLSGTSTKK